MKSHSKILGDDGEKDAGNGHGERDS